MLNRDFHLHSIPQQELTDWSLAARECGRLNQIATPLLGFSMHERMEEWILSRQLGLIIHSSHFEDLYFGQCVCVCVLLRIEPGPCTYLISTSLLTYILSPIPGEF